MAAESAEIRFARYKAIVDDWPAFVESCKTPLPRVLWANPLAGDLERTHQLVMAQWPEAQPLPWREHAWRFHPGTPLGNTRPYSLGLVHAQEESALWAVDALGLQPGMRVLDLCAAPGNKTAQIAVALGDRGLVVANERKSSRVAGLRGNLSRLRVTCAAVCCGDGVRFRSETLFDAVLVDVPCSCEGTARKHLAEGHRGGAGEYRESITQIQTALLRNAARHTRPGGTIVYSTCTFAPEENEGVLQRVPELEVVPIAAPPLHTSPALGEWNGARFRADTSHALRLWPHHNDTGGFFVAKLRKG
ncbi:MAG: 16S rRNA C967 or C1407 C5-methylase (RsmB/RsmF family) [Bradymonadia bacterium]